MYSVVAPVDRDIFLNISISKHLSIFWTGAFNWNDMAKRTGIKSQKVFLYCSFFQCIIVGVEWLDYIPTSIILIGDTVITLLEVIWNFKNINSMSFTITSCCFFFFFQILFRVICLYMFSVSFPVWTLDFAVCTLFFSHYLWTILKTKKNIDSDVYWSSVQPNTTYLQWQLTYTRQRKPLLTKSQFKKEKVNSRPARLIDAIY